jgi:DNA-binding GntR family transcriptional regulator
MMGYQQESFKRSTLADTVHDKLRGLLITGALSPGEKLTLRGLADQFGTSVMPVREAVNRLSAEGCLAILPNRTVRVSCPNPVAFAELVKIRCALEGLATEVACKQISSTKLQRIRQAVARFERQGTKPRPNPTMLSRTNRDLHFTIYRAAQMPRLFDMIEGLWVQVAPAISLTLRHATRGIIQWESFEHHARLLDSLVNRDPVRARQAVVADIRSTGAFILKTGVLDAFDLSTGPVTPQSLRAARVRRL